MECTLRLSHCEPSHDCSLAPFAHRAAAVQMLTKTCPSALWMCEMTRMSAGLALAAVVTQAVADTSRSTDAVPTQYLSGTGERTSQKPSLEQANARGRRKPCGLI